MSDEIGLPYTDYDSWYATYPDTTEYEQGMKDAFEAGRKLAVGRDESGLWEKLAAATCEGCQRGIIINTIAEYPSPSHYLPELQHYMVCQSKADAILPIIEAHVAGRDATIRRLRDRVQNYALEHHENYSHTGEFGKCEWHECVTARALLDSTGGK